MSKIYLYERQLIAKADVIVVDTKNIEIVDRIATTTKKKYL